jgi:hypothetical protein
MKLYIYYRISDKGRPKDKLPYADKFLCLSNAIEKFDINNFYMIADNCSKQTIDFIRSLGLSYEETSLGNSASFIYMMDKIIRNHKPDDCVYLLEDDYIHCTNSKEVLLEGLEIADYVSLYDHPDKYFLEKSGQGSPFNYNNLQKTMLYVTKSTHWREANSTTMTFACRVKTLQEDYFVWKKYCSIAKTPKDFYAFITLTTRSLLQAIIFLPRLKNHRRAALILFSNILTRRKMRKLISVIPAYATHTDTKWIAPCINWEHIE